MEIYAYMKKLFNKLQNKLIGVEKAVFMGIGEEKLRDDAVGIYVISELLSYSNDRFLFINAGIDPMARIEDIVNFNPSHLILLDTCNLTKPPGTVALIERENIKEYVPISTHTIPIHLVVDLLIEKLPELTVFMIGIVPESLEGFSDLNLYKEDKFSLEERSEHEDLPFFEFNLTNTIQKVADQIIEIIRQIILNL
jgi:hydrogenase maturation protease